MKSREEIMNMLEAFDVAGSLRGAGELAGVSHHTVARYVAERDAGELAGDGPRRRGRIIDPFLAKIEEWVERSHAEIRADRAFDKLTALGCTGSERTVRRAVAEVKANHRRGRRRGYRPWIPEPGMWAQRDWGAGPAISGRATVLVCAWLAWSRFRVVILCWDRRLASVIGCVDCAMRAFGGAPTYWLTDNERTVTIERVAGVPVRHLEMVAIGGHYGVTIATCVPADPESKGGSEATVRVAKADLVPTDANLRGDYTSWAELVDACDAWMAEVNGREHRVTRRAPVEMLVEEQQRLHRLPEAPYTAVFGETRKGSWNSTVSFGGVTYSVPHALADETVWVRVDGERVAVTHCAPSGPVEVARHQRSTPGHPMIDDAHYPPRPAGPLERRPKPTSAAEAEFLALGEGARLWLVEAASAGMSRIKTKMAQAVDLARLHGQISVDWALGHAATYARFADGDLVSILAAHPLGDRDTAGEEPFAAARHTRLGRLRRRPMNPAPIDEVVDLLRTLRLPHMRAAAPELLATAEAQRWEPAEAMRALLTEELAGRQASSIRARRKAAGFPTAKTFDIWDETVSSIPAPTQRALRTLEWIQRHENLVVCGPSHTPKTHFLEALGQAAVDAGHKVTWFSLEHLGALVRRHSADDTATKAIKRIMRADVIVIDDIGLLPVTTETAEALYRVVDAAYENAPSPCRATCTRPRRTRSTERVQGRA